MSADPAWGDWNESDDRARSTLQHDAYSYDDVDGFVTDLLGFVRGGLARDEPVLIAVPGPNLALLYAGLSVQEAAQVRMRDMAVSGRNPGRILGSVLTAFVHEHPGHRVRIISEAIWADRTDEEYLACVEHEALINVALADAPAHIVCPYDRTNLPPRVLADATRTHPTLAWGCHRRDSPSYGDPRAVAAAFDPSLSALPDDAEVVVVNTATGPRTARQLAHEVGEGLGLSPQRLADLRIAVHELATNTILHAGGSGLLSIWKAGNHLVVQADDGGRITDPLVGRRPLGPRRSVTGYTSSTRSPTSCACTAPAMAPACAPTSGTPDRTSSPRRPRRHRITGTASPRRSNGRSSEPGPALMRLGNPSVPPREYRRRPGRCPLPGASARASLGVPAIGQ